MPFEFNTIATGLSSCQQSGSTFTQSNHDSRMEESDLELRYKCLPHLVRNIPIGIVLFLVNPALASVIVAYVSLNA
jgi:hypothetical protein